MPALQHTTEDPFSGQQRVSLEAIGVRDGGRLAQLLNFQHNLLAYPEPIPYLQLGTVKPPASQILSKATWRGIEPKLSIEPGDAFPGQQADLPPVGLAGAGMAVAHQSPTSAKLTLAHVHLGFNPPLARANGND